MRTIKLSKPRVVLGLIFLLLAFAVHWYWLGANKPRVPLHEQERGLAAYQSQCAACHGENAEGDSQHMAGSLASMPQWYLEEQLERFRSGIRGAHPDDQYGQQMRAVALQLTVEGQKEILDFLATLPAAAPEVTLDGDLEWGRELYDVRCAMCHRYNGHGMIGFKSAPLNGLQDWYLLEQMDKFDRGLRGYHPDDELGLKMRKELDSLPNEADRRAVLRYINQLARVYPAKGKNGLNTKIPAQIEDPSRH